MRFSGTEYPAPWALKRDPRTPLPRSQVLAVRKLRKGSACTSPQLEHHPPELIEGEARGVNDAKPFTSHDDGRSLLQEGAVPRGRRRPRLARESAAVVQGGGDGCGKELNSWFTEAALHPKPSPVPVPETPKPGKPMSSLPPACRQVLAAPGSHSERATLDRGVAH
jgi:hypothetical protein